MERSSVPITTGFTITHLTQLEQEHAPIEVRGNDFAECDLEIQNEAVKFAENMPLTAFRKCDLIIFRGSDGYCFNIIELTNDIDFQEDDTQVEGKREYFDILKMRKM